MADHPLASGLLGGNIAAVARALSIVENRRNGFEQLLGALHPRVGGARRIGVTGPPGAGKSTLTERMVRAFREQHLRVAVVAVDPTSPFTGGALLGDRIRMEHVALDPGVYIRSMATRGSLGGIATTTREACDVLDAAGFDRIIVETVGVGQSELDVTTMADSTLLVLVPESGDGIQALKSGLIEAVDCFVVNKADRPGAEALRRELEVSLDLRDASVAVRRARGRASTSASSDNAAQWRPPICLTTASTGEGVAEVVAALDDHWQWLERDGSLARRRRTRTQRQMHEVVDRAMRRWLWDESGAEEAINGQVDDVVAGRSTPYAVADELVMGLKSGART